MLDCEPRLQQRSANTVVNYITAMMTKVQLTWQDRASPGSESATVRMEIWPVRSWQTKKPVRSGMKKPARTAVFGSLKTVSRLRRRVAPLRAEVRLLQACRKAYASSAQSRGLAVDRSAERERTRTRKLNPKPRPDSRPGGTRVASSRPDRNKETAGRTE